MISFTSGVTSNTPHDPQVAIIEWRKIIISPFTSETRISSANLVATGRQLQADFLQGQAMR
jgi:hypothetical protein